MISPIESTAGKAKAPTYHLKIVLMDSNPPIWRRLQVPANANLGWLHAVLQLAMGWTNSHLHQFNVGGRCYSDPRQLSAEYQDEPEVLDESKSTLRQVVPDEGAQFGYEYDFGDSWTHAISVEKILPPDPPLATFALCLAGARACPPEDCGGVWGYADLLKILKNRKHPEHKSMKEWIGGSFDAECFEITQTNRWLRKLKWPRVTEAQLRNVLLARHGYRA